MQIPELAAEHYPAHFESLAVYADWLAGPGVERGLIGPREVDRLWQRHILNCAVVADECSEITQTASVLDVGTGAGLPGIVWAIVRPDLRVTLLDSMKRRTDFLTELVQALDLAPRVDVVRGRVEQMAGLGKFDVVTARAVAPLSRLVPWLAPHVRSGGHIVALKGKSVDQEILDAAPALAQIGALSSRVHSFGGWLDQPTAVAVISGF